MAKTAFSATKHDKSTLNSGNQYTKDDQMSIEALNNTIENSLYAVEKADTAVTSSNSAVSTANSANTKATNAVNTANTASTTANDAKTKSESALATANTALSNSTEAVTTANSTISIANSANTKAENAVTTANSANTKAENAVKTSDEAKKIAQDALNSATEGVGSQVTVGGEVVGVFDADTKLDKSGGTMSGDIYLPLNTYIRTDNSAVLGAAGTGVRVGNPDKALELRGSASNPSYNGSTVALTTDNVASATKATQDGSGNVITSKYTTLDTTQTISGQKTFSKAPHFTAGINRYSKSSSADTTTTATNTTWHRQYEDYLDKNGKRLGVIGSVQTGDGYYGVYLQGGNQSSLNVLTDGTNGRILTSNTLQLSKTTDASNDYTKEPALVIGLKTGARLHIDNNEIQAFNGEATADNPTPTAWLGINKAGGDIGFATNSGGGMNFQPKTGLIPSVTNQLSLGNSTYGFKDIHIKGALYFD